MNDLLIENGLVLTLDSSRRIIRNGSIAINHGTIVAVDKAETVRRTHSARKVISGQGKIILPGLVNAHVHTVEQLERGMADEGADVFQRVFKRTLLYEGVLTPEETYVSSLLCCGEMIRTGTTTIAEVGAHPIHYNATAQAFMDAGIRAIIGKHGMDIPLAPVSPALFETTDQCIDRACQLIKRWHNTAGGRIRGSVVVTSLRSGTKELLQRSKRLADDFGVILQVHMNPGNSGFVEQMMKLHGACHVKYLDVIGSLGPNVLLVHMSYPTTDEEVEIMRLRDSKACHCPGSSLHGGHGVTLAKIPELLEAGVTVALGTDAAPSGNFNDMVRVMYLAAGIHKDVRKAPGIMPPETVLEMATLHGARALLWDNEIGSIEVGKKADLAIFDTERPEWLPLLNPVSNLVYSASGDSCETVIIDGKVVMEKGKILTFNERELLLKATSMAEAIMRRAGLDARTKWPIV